jgi:hypothetical protein
MNKRSLLIAVLILIIAASLSSAKLFCATTFKLKDSPAGSSHPASSVGIGTGKGASPSTGPLTGEASGDSGGGETAGSQASSSQNSLQAQIVQKYTDQLDSTGSSYEGRLNSLTASALSEYQSAKSSDPNADIAPLANKYYAAGQALQAECDSQMYPIIDAYERELRANSLPVDAATRARADYDAAKSNRAGQILSSKP